MRISEPFSHGMQPPLLNDVPRSDKVPWINTEIIIVKTGSPMRTFPGVVTDVLCNQATSSGLKVEVQLTILEAVGPFRRVILDYDDVVEARCVDLNQIHYC